MLEFLSRFLAEVVFDIGTVCILVMLLSKEGKKWKIMSVVFFAVISVPYLSQKNFFTVWLIPFWFLLIPVGVFLLFKNAKTYAYHIALNPPTKTNQQTVEPSKNGLAKRLKNLENLNIFLMGTVLVLAVAVYFRQSLMVLQVPFFLLGVVSLFVIGVFFFMSDKNSINRKLSVNMITFLLSSYVITMYAFLNLLLFLFAYFSLSLLNSSIISSVMIGVFFMMVEYVLLRIERELVSSEPSHSLCEQYSRYFSMNSRINLLLILVLSDTPLFYSMFLEQNMTYAIWWTYGFTIFITFEFINTLRHNLDFKMKTRLLERQNVQEELDKLNK